MRLFAPTPSTATPRRSDIGRPSARDHSAATDLVRGLDPIALFGGKPRNTPSVPAVSDPGDRSEHEADRLADHVLRLPDPPRAETPLAATHLPADTPAWLGAGRPLPSATRN